MSERDCWEAAELEEFRDDLLQGRPPSGGCYFGAGEIERILEDCRVSSPASSAFYPKEIRPYLDLKLLQGHNFRLVIMCSALVCLRSPFPLVSF